MSNEIQILPDEALEDLQLQGLRILQKKHGFRFSMDAVLLASFVRAGANDRITDFGTGTGILPLLLYGHGKGASFDAFEIMPEVADMAQRTMYLNDLSERIRIHCCPAEDALAVLPERSADIIVSNPPYGLPGTTLQNPDPQRNAARHQGEAGLVQWFRTARRLLRGKGRMYLIYPAPRMLDLMLQLQKAGMEPKSFRLIYPRADAPANLVLIEAVKDARPMLHPMPPLIIYEPDGGYTKELQTIYGLQS